MKKLTDKQREFVKHKAFGIRSRDAAVAAGFSARSADVQASQLLARTDIQAAIKALKKEMRAQAKVSGVPMPKDAEEADAHDLDMPKKHYDDPMLFLHDVMNHRKLPIALRAEYAFKLMPYKHARIAEKGKKEDAVDRAHKIAGTGGNKVPKRAKFGPKQPPNLRVVGGKG